MNNERKEKKKNLSYRRISNNLCRYFPLKEAEKSYQHLSMLKVCLKTSCQSQERSRGGRGGGNTVTLEKSNQHYIFKVIKININCDKSQANSMYGMRE